MRGINQVFALGNLGRDADIKQTQTGTTLANFSLGCSYSVKDQNAQNGWREETEWIRVVCWSPSDWLQGQLKKGRPIHVSGRLQTRKWQDQNGQDRYTTEVVCNASGVIPVNPLKGEHQSNVAPAQPQQAPPSPPQDWRSKPVDTDEEIPF